MCVCKDMYAVYMLIHTFQISNYVSCVYVCACMHACALHTSSVMSWCTCVCVSMHAHVGIVYQIYIFMYVCILGYMHMRCISTYSAVCVYVGVHSCVLYISINILCISVYICVC